MDVRRLALLRELADRGTIAAVAEATRRTPSGVSQQLKQLEREAGVPLTERAGRGVVLTPAGRALARSAADIATAIEHAESLWEEFRTRPTGDVTISVIETAAELLLPGVFRRLADTDVVLHVEEIDQQFADYADFTADSDLVVAQSIVEERSWRERGLVVAPIMVEPFRVVLAADHPLAGRSALSPQDLAGETWIGAPEGSAYDQLLGQIELANGERARIAQRYATIGIMRVMVEAGFGVALMPRFSAVSERGGTVSVPIEGVRAERTISALMRPERAVRPSVRLVVETFRAEAAALLAERG